MVLKVNHSLSKVKGKRCLTMQILESDYFKYNNQGQPFFIKVKGKRCLILPILDSDYFNHNMQGQPFIIEVKFKRCLIRQTLDNIFLILDIYVIYSRLINFIKVSDLIDLRNNILQFVMTL